VRPLWEGDSRVVKRSGRDEPTWVVIHIQYTTQRISLYSCHYLKLAKKCPAFLIIFYIFFSYKIGEQEGEHLCPEVVVEEVAKIMYTNVSKCKNDKIK
jgi:hypothetical protein